MSDYFVIRCSEDGDVTVEKMVQSELLSRICESYYGTQETLDHVPHYDPQSWGTTGLLVIKGSVVQATPVDVVKEFTVE